MTTDYGNDVRQIVEAVAGTFPWWAYHDNLAQLAREMFDQGDEGNVCHMLEKPWQYDAEWVAIRAKEES